MNAQIQGRKVGGAGLLGCFRRGQRIADSAPEVEFIGKIRLYIEVIADRFGMQGKSRRIHGGARTNRRGSRGQRRETDPRARSGSRRAPAAAGRTPPSGPGWHHLPAPPARRAADPEKSATTRPGRVIELRGCSNRRFPCRRRRPGRCRVLCRRARTNRRFRKRHSENGEAPERHQVLSAMRTTTPSAIESGGLKTTCSLASSPDSTSMVLPKSRPWTMLLSFTRC